MELEDLGSPEDPGRWAAWQALAPHALELADQVDGCAEMDPQTRLASADLAEMAARHLQALGLFEQARQRYEAVLAVRRALQGDEHPATLDCRHLLASAMHDLGDLLLARAGYQAVWEISGRVRGEEHTNTLTARHELGRVLHDQGYLEEAHEHLAQVFTASSRLAASTGRRPHVRCPTHHGGTSGCTAWRSNWAASVPVISRAPSTWPSPSLLCY